MNKEIIENISKDLNIKEVQVEKTLKLLEEGNTIPFIARYRKEVTGNLDEEQIRKINEVYEYEVNLLKRKEDVIRLIDEKGLLTLELKNDIMKASKLVEVEDLYRPFKEKKKTKATEAIKLGLEPLAKQMLEPNYGKQKEAPRPPHGNHLRYRDSGERGTLYHRRGRPAWARGNFSERENPNDPAPRQALPQAVEIRQEK